MPESDWIDADLVVVNRPYLTDSRQTSPLQAALDGNITTVERLLDRPLDPDAQHIPNDEDEDDDSNHNDPPSCGCARRTPGSRALLAGSWS